MNLQEEPCSGENMSDKLAQLQLEEIKGAREKQQQQKDKEFQRCSEMFCVNFCLWRGLVMRQCSHFPYKRADCVFSCFWGYRLLALYFLGRALRFSQWCSPVQSGRVEAQRYEIVLTVKAGNKIRTHAHRLPSDSLFLIMLYFYRYVEALRVQIQEKMRLYNVTLPALCCCGPGFWDAHPDTCANNCIFYKNHRGKFLEEMVGAWWLLKKQQQK